MNFNDKIESFFSDYILEYINKYPKHNYYIYADYLELLSLFSNDNLVTPSDYLDRLEEKFELTSRFLKIDESEEEEEEEFESDSDSDRAELNDLKERFSLTIFRVVNERSSLFSGDYPFIVTNNTIVLKQQFTEKNKIYLSLLLSSSLDIFNKFNHELTKEFETISYYALKNFMPQHSIVKSFGKNTGYTGNAKTKISSLAAELKVEINNKAFSQIPTTNMQEKGLDLIAWIPFDDSVPNSIYLLAQCACQKDINKKIAEALRFIRYFDFHVISPISSLFIPHTIVEQNKNIFIGNDDISIDTLIFDRKRILNYLNDTNFFVHLDSSKLVDKCIEYIEPVA